MRTAADWVAFSRRWFDTSSWPAKTDAELAAESMRKRSRPPPADGRSWVRTCQRWDITPEARYEMGRTVSEVGDALRFPHLAGIPRIAGSGWRQECPFCEISTREIGDESCPECGRELIHRFESE